MAADKNISCKDSRKSSTILEVRFSTTMICFRSSVAGFSLFSGHWSQPDRWSDLVSHAHRFFDGKFEQLYILDKTQYDLPIKH